MSVQKSSMAMLNLTMSHNKVKEERHDEAEICELAAKMREEHKVASAKLAAQQQQNLANRSAGINHQTMVAGQTNMLNYLTRKTNIPNSISISQSDAKSKLENGIDDKKPCDEESQRGHFGWATFGNIHIPYIMRQGEQYCAVRMVEMKLLNKHLTYLHQDIYSCTCVRSYYITEAESRLFNEINQKHCDAQFGRDSFSLKDLVVRLSDANKFYHFLDICYKKLTQRNSTPNEKCGFIRINKESVVPYTVRDKQQFVPLFYFEGETDNLKLKAEYLSGWDLSYLKFCCKVQGIRNELFASDSVAVISLTDIKSYFPTGTEFEDYWPNKVVDTQLLYTGNTAQKASNSSVHWTRQPAAPPPKSNNIPVASNMSKNAIANATSARKQSPYVQQMQSTQQRQQMQAVAAAAAALQQQQQQQQQPSSRSLNAAVQALNCFTSMSGAQQAFSANMLTSPNEQFARLAAAAQATQQQHAQRNSYSQRSMQNQMVGRSTYPNYGSSALNLGTMGNQRIQQPPPLVPASNQNTISAEAVQRHMMQQQQQQQQQQQRRRIMPQQAHQSNNGFTQIPDDPTSPHRGPYKVSRMQVQNVTVPCINMKPFLHTEQLMTLQDLNEHFFRNISLETCKSMLMAIQLELFIGNRQQYQAFKDAGRNVDNMPLVQVQDVMKYMPQLTYMVQNQEQAPAKRSRIS